MAILFEVDRKFQDRFCRMLRKMGYDYDGTPYKENPMQCFTVRPYWWGNEDAEEAELPNFEAPQIGLKLWWYKYPLRSSYCTMQFTEEVMNKLERIVEETNPHDQV